MRGRPGNMRGTFTAMRFLLVAAVAAWLCTAVPAPSEPAISLALQETIPMRGVIGRIDHLAIDVMGGRLFVCALGSDAVEVLDLRGGSVAATISGLREPQGVVYLSDRNKLYVSNGGTGELDVFDGSTLRVATRIDLGSDADNLRYDPTARSLLVGAGHSLAVIDVSDDRVAGAVPLPGHPEGFALEQPGGRIFVNVPLPSRSVFVVDRKANAVSGRWPVGGLLSDTFSNFPLNVDESSRRVFVGTATTHVHASTPS